MEKLGFLKRELASREKVFETVLQGTAVLVDAKEEVYLGFEFDAAGARWLLLTKPENPGEEPEKTIITREQALDYIDQYVAFSNNLTAMINAEISWAESTLPVDEPEPLERVEHTCSCDNCTCTKTESTADNLQA